MNPGLLDRLNAEGGMTAIATSGGLVASAQFPQFVNLHPRAARRAARELADSRMVQLVRTRKNVAFIVLTQRTAQALGAHMPVPPKPSMLKFLTYQLCLARAEYFLQSGALVHTTSDLSFRSRKGERTMSRIKAIIEAQQGLLNERAMAVAERLESAPTQKLRDEAQRLRRLLRPVPKIVEAGRAALKHFRGLYLCAPTGHQSRFFFVDRATPVQSYDRLVETLRRFSAATMLRTHLDVGCGTELSQQRVSRHLKQTDMRLQVRVLNLNYERYVRTSAGIPPLVGRERIAQMLATSAPDVEASK
jgi:hypothetical protein